MKRQSIDDLFIRSFICRVCHLVLDCPVVQEVIPLRHQDVIILSHQRQEHPALNYTLFNSVYGQGYVCYWLENCNHLNAMDVFHLNHLLSPCIIYTARLPSTQLYETILASESD